MWYRARVREPWVSVLVLVIFLKVKLLTCSNSITSRVIQLIT